VLVLDTQQTILEFRSITALNDGFNGHLRALCYSHHIGLTIRSKRCNNRITKSPPNGVVDRAGKPLMNNS